MYTVAIYNFKGGAGKSTTTHNIGAGLAVMGYRVLIVDTDPQGHATLLFGVEPEPGVFDWLARPTRTSFSDVAILVERDQYAPANAPKNSGRVVLVPGDEDSMLLPLKLKTPSILRHRLDSIKDNFDFCLIDTPPTPSLMSVVTYSACDAVLYPTKCETLHIDGLRRAYEARHDASEIRQGMQMDDIKVLGVVPSMFRKSTLEHRQYHKWLLDNGFEVWSAVADSIIWAEASRERLPVFSYAPDSEQAREAWRMVKNFHDRVRASA